VEPAQDARLGLDSPRLFYPPLLGGVGLAGIGNKELPYFAADAEFRRLRDGTAAGSESADDASVSGCSPTLSPALTESALARATSDKEGVYIVVAGLAAKLAIRPRGSTHRVWSRHTVWIV
jgi:hypothetical protein